MDDLGPDSLISHVCKDKRDERRATYGALSSFGKEWIFF